MNTLLTLVRREFLEHRAIFMAPGILTLILVVGTAWGVWQAINATGEIEAVLGQLQSADPAQVRTLLKSLLSAVLVPFALPFNLVMSTVAGFYLLDCLHSERKDRSVLFWRSLPVSDAQTVLSKLFTALVAISVVELFAVIIAFALNGLVVSVGLIALGKNPLSLLWTPAPWVSGPLFLSYVLVAQALWFAPFAGWLLLVSSAARNAPFLWAAGVPAGLMYLEWLLLRSRVLFDAVAGHVEGFFETVLHTDRHFGFEADDLGDLLEQAAESDAPLSLLQLPDPLGLLTSPGLYVGLALTVVFVAGAVRMRRYHNV